MHSDIKGWRKEGATASAYGVETGGGTFSQVNMLFTRDLWEHAHARGAGGFYVKCCKYYQGNSCVTNPLCFLALILRKQTKTWVEVEVKGMMLVTG